MHLRFLGINGFEFGSHGKILLIDPYVSRDRVRMSVPAIVHKHIEAADMIVLGHSHFDHAADVAAIVGYTKAMIGGSETMLNICRHFKTPETRLCQFENHRPITLGPFSVTPLKSKHKEPMGYPGYYRRPPPKIDSVADYREGGTWALLVQCDGLSFLNIGSANLIDEELRGIQCDYLLAGIAGRAPDYLPRLLKCVNSKVLIPTHWDDYVNCPIEAPRAKIDMAAFYAEMKSIAPKQKIKVLNVLESMELQAP